MPALLVFFSDTVLMIQNFDISMIDIAIAHPTSSTLFANIATIGATRDKTMKVMSQLLEVTLCNVNVNM